MSEGAEHESCEQWDVTFAKNVEELKEKVDIYRLLDVLPFTYRMRGMS